MNDTWIDWCNTCDSSYTESTNCECYQYTPYELDKAIEEVERRFRDHPIKDK